MVNWQHKKGIYQLEVAFLNLDVESINSKRQVHNLQWHIGIVLVYRQGQHSIFLVCFESLIR